jgi:hypothetical protein
VYINTQEPLVLIELFEQRLKELEQATLHPGTTASVQEPTIDGISNNDSSSSSNDDDDNKLDISTPAVANTRTINVQDVDKFLDENDIDSNSKYSYDPDTGEIHISSDTSTNDGTDSSSIDSSG